MEMKKIRWLWVIPAMAFAFAGSLHAEEAGENGSTDNAVTCSAYECSTADYCFGNPCDGTWSFQADWLFWRPCNEGLILGYDDGLRFHEKPITPPEATEGENHIEFPTMGYFVKLDQKGKVAGPTSGGTSGFRFGIGYQAECSVWDMMLRWTYFDPKSVANISAKHHHELPVITPFTGLGITNAAIFVTPEIAPGFEFGYLPFKVKGSHRLILDFVDLEFGRRIDFCDSLSLRPHVDLRYFTLNQHYSIKTKGPVAFRVGTEGGFIGFAHTSEKFEYRFQGLGPRVGVNGEWYLGCGFGLYADTAASLILGDRRLKNKAKSFSKVGEPTVDITGTPPTEGLVTIAEGDRKSSGTCTKPIFELGIGLTYQRCLCDGKYATTFKLGWEHHFLGNHSISDAEAMINPILGSYVSTRDKGGLTIQGLTFSAMFQF